MPCLQSFSSASLSIARRKVLPLKLLTPPALLACFAFVATAGRAEEPPVLKVCLISGSLEYHSDETLAAFQKMLEAEYPVKCSRAFRKADDDVPGLEALETCDVALFFTRRLTVDGEQLERVKKYCQSGKPIVGVRTASHGFQKWLAFDKEILGGNYTNHFPEGPKQSVTIADKAKDHPILAGVKPFTSPGSLYKNTGIADDVEVLLYGAIPDHSEPVAWARNQNGRRVFYTSLGHPEDFKDPNFQRLLINGLFWTVKKTPTKKAP
jgi:type 1 glutamine amidotransferase